MIGYILIAWILIQMKAPTWTFVVLAIGVAFRLLQIGIEMGSKK